MKISRIISYILSLYIASIVMSCSNEHAFMEEGDKSFVESDDSELAVALMSAENMYSIVFGQSVQTRGLTLMSYQVDRLVKSRSGSNVSIYFLNYGKGFSM